jgi:hypothetical protein
MDHHHPIPASPCTRIVKRNRQKRSKRHVKALFFIPFLATMVQPTGAQRRQICRLSDRITYLSFQSDAWVVSDPKTNGAVPTKSCDCENIGSNHFCFLSNDESHCSATSNGGKPPLCFRQTFFHSIAQMFWTPMYFSMIILFLSLFTTKSGKTARNYAIGKCFPRYLKTQNERAINTILERERRVRREFRAVRNGFGWRPDGMREKISLKLRTKKLNLNTRLDATATATDGENVTSSFEEVSESAPISTPELEAPKPLRNKRSGDEYVSVASQDKDITCSICMVDIEDGERVADLPCGHNFHIACLKTWVLWRNTCPLCNAPDIAETHTTLVPHDPEAEDNPNPPTRNIYLEANSTFHTFGMNEDSRPAVGSLSSVLSAGALARSRPR